MCANRMLISLTFLLLFLLSFPSRFLRYSEIAFLPFSGFNNFPTNDYSILASRTCAFLTFIYFQFRILYLEPVTLSCIISNCTNVQLEKKVKIVFMLSEKLCQGDISLFLISRSFFLIFICHGLNKSAFNILRK